MAHIKTLRNCTPLKSREPRFLNVAASDRYLPTMLLSALLLTLASYAYRSDLFALGSPASSFVVDTGYAKYLGNHTYPNTVAYLGIPYAEPPVGDRRFRAPLPLNTARITAGARGAAIDATEYPDFCIQGTTGSEFRIKRCFKRSVYSPRHDVDGDAGGAGSEDCLKVNIYAPVHATKSSNRESTSSRWLRPKNMTLIFTGQFLFSFTFTAVVSAAAITHFDCIHLLFQAMSTEILRTGPSTTGSTRAPTWSSSLCTTGSPRSDFSLLPPCGTPLTGTSTQDSSTRCRRLSGCRRTSVASAATPRK